MEKALQGLTQQQNRALLAIVRYLKTTNDPKIQLIWEYLREAKRTGDYDTLVQRVETLSLKGETK